MLVETRGYKPLGLLLALILDMYLHQYGEYFMPVIQKSTSSDLVET